MNQLPLLKSPNGDIYEPCKSCPLKSEKYQSREKIDGIYHAFNGLQWALDNGYTVYPSSKDIEKDAVENQKGKYL